MNIFNVLCQGNIFYHRINQSLLLLPPAFIPYNVHLCYLNFIFKYIVAFNQ